MTLSDLSEREMDVLVLIDGHRTNRQIATELVLSVRTIEWHVSNILTKLPAADRLDAARIYREQTG